MPTPEKAPPVLKKYTFIAENPNIWFYSEDSSREIVALPKVDGWAFLGLGAYNFAYRRGDEVLKIQRDFSQQTDTPERSVRLWRLINPSMPARLEETQFGQGWISPYITGEQATDEEMFLAVVDIFNRTGRIVVDAMATENFKRLPTDEVICVDIGMALQLEQREDEHVAEDIRRQSVTSLTTWGNLSSAFDPFFLAYTPRYPKTVNTLKALLFIKSNRPDINQADFLKTNPRLIDKLSQSYDKTLSVDAEDLDRDLSAPEALPQQKIADSQAQLDSVKVALHDMKSPAPQLEKLQVFLMEKQEEMLFSPEPEQIQEEVMRKIDEFLAELLEEPEAHQEPATLKLLEALKSPSFDSKTKPSYDDSTAASKEIKSTLEEAKKGAEDDESAEASPRNITPKNKT